MGKMKRLSYRLNTPTVPHDCQLQILETSARFKVIAAGRRFGKTETGKLLMMQALYRKPDGIAWWIAPTYGMAAQVWHDLANSLAHLETRISAAQRRIDLPGGGHIAVRSAHNPDRLRGAGLDYAVLDEAAYMSASLWPEVVRPMLLERRGGAAFLSTPYGHNHFWELYKQGLDLDQPEWASFQFPSAANDLIDRAEIEALRAITPDLVYRAEYLAEFVDHMGAVFRNIDAVLTAPPDTQPDLSRRVVIGVDWGRDSDYTVCVALDADSCRMLAIDRFNGLSWAASRARVAQMSHRWNASAVWAESNSIGQPNIEALQAEGIPVRPFMTTSRSKQNLIDALAVAIERGGIALVPDPVLLAELKSYRLHALPGGGYRYAAPSGAHDDTVIALALAYHGARQGRFSLDFA
jgi:hypothetical protein